MGDRSLEVLEKYDFAVERTAKGRGVTLLHTDKGDMVFREYRGNGRHIGFVSPILEQLESRVDFKLEHYVKNTEGEYISCRNERERYIIKTYCESRPCDISSLADLMDSAEILAKFHRAAMEIEISDNSFEMPDMIATAKRRCQELRHIRKYLKNKKNKSEFEVTALDVFDIFWEEAQNSVNDVANSITDATKGLCHGAFNYHNIGFGEEKPVLYNFEKMQVGFIVTDLYGFLRKILEKYDWDMKLGYAILDKYDGIYPLTEADRELLVFLLSFPEKFWKLMNAYFNSKKVRIPVKNLEKLKITIKQNDRRQSFIATIK